MFREIISPILTGGAAASPVRMGEIIAGNMLSCFNYQ